MKSISCHRTQSIELLPAVGGGPPKVLLERGEGSWAVTWLLKKLDVPFFLSLIFLGPSSCQQGPLLGFQGGRHGGHTTDHRGQARVSPHRAGAAV